MERATVAPCHVWPRRAEFQCELAGKLIVLFAMLSCSSCAIAVMTSGPLRQPAQASARSCKARQLQTSCVESSTPHGKHQPWAGTRFMVFFCVASADDSSRQSLNWVRSTQAAQTGGRSLVILCLPGSCSHSVRWRSRQLCCCLAGSVLQQLQALRSQTALAGQVGGARRAAIANVDDIKH